MKNFHLLILIQLLVALLVNFHPIFTTLHALITAGFGIYFSLTDKNTHRSLIVIFYIIGSELLWRGFKASIFWEFGKYSVIVILLILMNRFGLSKLRRKSGFLIVLLLLPSFVSLEEFNRQDIAHSISGPFCMGLAMVIFSNNIISISQLRTYCFAALMPIISLFALTFYSTIQFGAYDMEAAYIYEATTVGIGPNQVSNILGLGILLCFLLSILDKRYGDFYRIIGLLLFFQTIITFSRGGLWSALIAIIFAIVYTIKASPRKSKFLLGLVTFSGLLYFYIIPKIDDLSEGTLSERYLDTDLSRREFLIASELNAFRENPIFGLGPGESRKYRIQISGSKKHSHTEYSRLMSEHGLFGISIILILFFTTVKTFSSNLGLSKGISISFAIWSLLFMFHSATRLAAPCVIFALSLSRFNFNKKELIN